MRFWIRELAGWLLVALGLFIFYICFVFLFVERPPLIIEVSFLTFIGFIIFRSGIHLWKVAVAARVCMATARTTSDQTKVKKDVRRTTSVATD